VTRQEKIQQIITDCGEREFRLKQVIHAIYKERVTNYADITSIPESLRTRLSAELGEVLTIKPISTVTGKDVQKDLFETQDGAKLESVFMSREMNSEASTEDPSDGRETLCVSSQAGCALNCAFCYTGTMGFQKNLSEDEICDQILFYRNGKQFSGTVSFMGMGEPFANLDNVFAALHTLTDSDKFGMGERKVNISTVGLVPGIERLTKEFPQINLAFSLHTAFEQQRAELMPVSLAYPISAVMDALDRHIIKTHRKVFISYILMAGINDSNDHAAALAALLKARGGHSYLYHVNLINFNGEGAGLPFKALPQEKISAFSIMLTKKGIPNTIRRSFGLEIGAACGQLCAKV
jgi:23S rRNA (adenine-C8)-methyltransferase